jgi:hypothetical protein
MLRTVSLIALPMLFSAGLGHAQAQRRLDAEYISPEHPVFVNDRKCEILR